MDASRTFPNNYAISASSGSYSTASGTYVAVTNLSCTITTSGRPVVMKLIPETGVSGHIRIERTGSSGTIGILKITKNSSTVYETDFDFVDTISVSAQGTGSISSQGTNTGNSTANTGITAGANSGIAIARSYSRLSFPCSIINGIDYSVAGNAGTYTYTVSVGAGDTFSVTNCVLVVYEI